MAKRVVVLFVEGSTEIEFHKAVIKRAHDLMPTQFTCSVEYLDMYGIGNYQKDAIRKFNKLKDKYEEDTEYLAFLCYDSDVFQLSKKPPINRNEVRDAIKDAGALKVADIVAKSSIEEWFLMDLPGVLSYLRLSKKTKRPQGNGQEALKKLFKNANKVYVKGGKTEGFIKKLDISIIMASCCKSLLPLCKAIGFDCALTCNK